MFARNLRPALVLLVLMTLLTGFAYPLATTAIAGLLFPHQAAGSLVGKDGKVIGSLLIGQSFAGETYFHGRPSATTDTDPNDPTKTVPAPYNATNSGGSNLGPTAKALVERVRDDVGKLKAGKLRAGNPAGPVPVDLVTASASGLDPHITPAAAEFQVPRIAKARGMPEEQVRHYVEQATEGRTLGVLGEPRVNVLRLNLMLDDLGGL